MHRRRTSRPPFSSALRVLTAALLALVIGGVGCFSTPEPALAAGESPTLRRIDWIVASLAPGEQKVLSFEAAVVNTQPTDIIPNQALFENTWDGGVAPDGTVREPANSTNVIEHVSDGDYMVASEEIAVTGIVSETGGDLMFLLTMAIILACAVGTGVVVMARSRFRA